MIVDSSLPINKFIKEFHKWRVVLWNLSLQDFKDRYLGSYLGIIWAFVNPIITVLIYWFIFELGFKSAPVKNLPFWLWLIAGICPWFFFSDAVLGSTHSIIEKAYLVKKVVFRVGLLPLAKIISASFVHLFFLGIIFIIFSLNGYFPSFYSLQIFYYTSCLFLLLMGISLITSSLVIFIRDVAPLVSVVIQFGFWLTPIVWSTDLLPTGLRNYFKFNPIFYISEGYRDAFIYKVWFWQKPLWTLYFWLITLSILILSWAIFKKLRPHFADVL